MAVSESSNILLYGRGVFTTIAFQGGEPFLWEKHWTRLTTGAAKTGIDISLHSEVSVRNAVGKAIRDFPAAAGRVRASFLDESASGLWGGEHEARTSLSILVAERRGPLVDLRITVSPVLVNSTSPLAGVKSCNYLEPLMAKAEGRSRGFGEAIRVNERGEVASACLANVFWVQGGRLFTPSLKTGCLAGTTREFILENLECEEVEVGIDDFRRADEIFLTSAGIGVVQAAGFEARELNCRDHPIMTLPPF